MKEIIYIAFPKHLYHKILVRSGGRLDPAILAADQVEGFIERNMMDSTFWSEEGLKQFEAEFQAMAKNNFGNPEMGYQWQQVFLPNGTKMRITYKNRNYFAQVQNERVVADGKKYSSPSEWVSAKADNTSRNAWRDVWIMRPDESAWRFANTLREKE